MPSQATINRWRIQFIKLFNYVFLALEFSTLGNFQTNDNTNARDRSSIDGKFFEAILAICQNSAISDDEDSNVFNFVVIGVPHVVSKHSETIAKEIIKIVKCIDEAQRGHICVVD